MAQVCIFLVDDSTIYLNSGKAALEEMYTVVTIPSGEKLLSMLARMKPDLILLDVEMPGLSGYETIVSIKSNPEWADIPVIFLTGKADSESELLGLSLGAVDYIIKPFTKPLLLKRIELHLQLQAQKNELRMFNTNLTHMVKERTNDVTDLQNAIVSWAAEVIEFRDEETGHHVHRVQQYLKILLEAMMEQEVYADEASSWDLDAFLRSAMLHDVGKIRIRDEILLKTSRLTVEEFEIIKLHSLYGKVLLESLEEKVPNQKFLEYAKTLAYMHHERWDGTGYPNQLKAVDIPLQARMMSLADVYDALISERPYKEAFTHDESMLIIEKGRGTQFDPKLVDLFLSKAEKIKFVSEEVKSG